MKMLETNQAVIKAILDDMTMTKEDAITKIAEIMTNRDVEIYRLKTELAQNWSESF